VTASSRRALSTTAMATTRAMGGKSGGAGGDDGGPATEKALTHVDGAGRAAMVDVGGKPSTTRTVSE
jgi:xanthine dehydrogenase molybdopterin-binding subunit B